MPEPKPPQDEALKRFDARYEAVAKSNARKPREFDKAVGTEAGYRVLGELFGGIFGGLGLGWVLDRYAGTTPWGVIGGVVIGTVLAVYLIYRSAERADAGAAPSTAQGDADPGEVDNEGRDKRGET
jgi:ATP synthase protein I